MKDLNGAELEKGAIYHILGSGSKAVVGKYKHETDSSIVFDKVAIKNYKDSVLIYTWKRQLSKWKMLDSCPVLRVSQEVIDKYQIS